MRLLDATDIYIIPIKRLQEGDERGNRQKINK
jgi:hypothetical protein